MSEPNKASDEQIALLRNGVEIDIFNGKALQVPAFQQRAVALTAILDELDRYRQAFEGAVTIQYEFVSPFDGSTRVWRDSPNTWNGQSPRSARKLYAAPQTEEKEQ